MRVRDFLKYYGEEVSRCDSALEVYALYTELIPQAGLTLDDFYEELAATDLDVGFEFLDHSVAGAALKFGTIYIDMSKASDATRV